MREVVGNLGLSNSEIDTSKNSVNGKSFRIIESDDNLVMDIKDSLGLDYFLAKLLVNRGVKSVEDAKNFINPMIKNLIPDPFNLLDIEKAITRIIAAIKNNEKIVVFGDYDVDGATSSGILYKFFAALGIDIEVYIPNRFTEGYGPNLKAFKKFKESGVGLIITVDCGTQSFDEAIFAKENGMGLVIIDHHISGKEIPCADAVVNPNRLDESFEEKAIAAVGVTFLVLVAVNSRLRENLFFEEKSIDEPNLLDLLDLVALGTVCDIMPICGINRAFVRYGLKLLSSRKNLGIRALCNILSLDDRIESHHLGFVIGPRINAGGRVGKGNLGVSLLIESDYGKAIDIAKEIDLLNEERKVIEAEIIGKAISQIESTNIQDNTFVIAYGENWHHGVLGIIASRMRERYNRPAVIMSLQSDGTAKGSTRSIPGIDIGSIISSAKAEGILIDGGGHEMAGGFTVSKEKIQEFYKYLNNSVVNPKQSLKKALVLDVDISLPISSITPDLVSKISVAAPFGNKNPQPRFLLNKVYVSHVTKLKNNHMMLVVKDTSHDKRELKCLLYRLLETNLGQSLLSTYDKQVSLYGYLQFNKRFINHINFVIEDAIIFD